MKYWSSLAKDISPYVPGEQPKRPMIKLNTNENPYPPSPKAVAAMQAAADDRLRLYPDPASGALRAAIAQAEGVSEDMVFVGNGSDEVLALCFLAYCDKNRPVRFCDVTYSFSPVYASLFGIEAKILPLKEDFSLPMDLLCRDEGTVIFPNPNAPTSLAVGLEEISAIAAGNPSSAVIVDEAYVAFGADSAVALLPKHDNILVVRTFSKSHSLAGLRVGYAIANPELIQALWRVKDSFNSYPMDRIAQAGAEASILDRDYFETTRQAIIATRERSRAALLQMGFTCLPSMSNFLFARPKRGNAKEVMEALREAGILVRHFSAPRTAEYLRITVGTDEEMDALLTALSRILS